MLIKLYLSGVCVSITCGFHHNKIDFNGMRMSEKSFFNRRVRKVDAKHAKGKPSFSVLCDLCEKPWRPLRLMDFDFL